MIKDNKMATPKKEKQTYTREQVIELLKRQIADCADSIQGNCSEYCAKKKILETKIVEV
jgi:hypothetical protein